MAVVQLLQVLLILHFFVANVSSGTNVNRQLDIPAYKEFFSQVSSQRAKDEEKIKSVIGTVASGEREDFKPPLPVSLYAEVNNTSVKSGDLLTPHDSNSVVELNNTKILRTVESRNVSGYQQTSSGLLIGGFSPSVQVQQMISGSKGQDFEFNPAFKSSSHGSILLNSPTPREVSNKNTVLGEKQEPFRPTKPFSILPLHLRTVPSTNHSSSSSEIHSSKAASARAIRFQGLTNSHTVPSQTTNVDDWIPISAPIQYPAISFSSQIVTSKPPGSNRLVLQTTTSNPNAWTLQKEEEYKNENETKGQVELGSSSVIASNGTIGVVDNDSNPSFLRGISFRKPSRPLYGKVLYPSKKYPPARPPVTKPVYKAPTSVNQIINGGRGVNSPAQPVRYPVHRPVHYPAHRPTHPPTRQPTYQPTYQPVHQPIVNLYPATVNSGHTISENSLYGTGDGREVANIDFKNAFPPSNNQVTNVGYANPFSSINPDPPVLRQIDGPGYNNSPPSPVQTNFEDDIGTISSFSYFRHLESELSGPKGFDNAFSVHAGRNIAKQFQQNMFDQTGFPGNGQGARTNSGVRTGRGK